MDTHEKAKGQSHGGDFPRLAGPWLRKEQLPTVRTDVGFFSVDVKKVLMKRVW